MWPPAIFRGDWAHFNPQLTLSRRDWLVLFSKSGYIRENEDMFENILWSFLSARNCNGSSNEYAIWFVKIIGIYIRIRLHKHTWSIRCIWMWHPQMVYWLVFGKVWAVWSYLLKQFALSIIISMRPPSLHHRRTGPLESPNVLPKSNFIRKLCETNIFGPHFDLLWVLNRVTSMFLNKVRSSGLSIWPSDFIEYVAIARHNLGDVFGGNCIWQISYQSANSKRTKEFFYVFVAAATVFVHATPTQGKQQKFIQNGQYFVNSISRTQKWFDRK